MCSDIGPQCGQQQQSGDDQEIVRSAVLVQAHTLMWMHKHSSSGSDYLQWKNS